ncbi:endoplasmic reticulum junction formation protein lunapark-B [Oryzias melastigma]|uniref:Endoplasmic reticulum junction formation protein lunapark n=1 Tax=Oryzias melastigma TaxID=30732 RepID=A0A3B3CY84_ORYME|nr:endoplasmic reticulum junction formation protein lunapark-B [Oryzias melastigma]XP_024153116.1 endoplasmic reticulum junction formation protein lunapark-B [Oryzias melastigma]XP_024153117.1 endoplasmic reticulum junction formation protein lunapark-B [Oryzias melastigma]XP_024153118.1 endoplasmic reticulum junction formation protein lunapark-B [Oryzias melastigma]XP_024153119.1 endoplasmic reticulum junction formation protein lunapark-B [Oryzias melastigma]
MGALISRWKTKPTTVEQLENLEKEIKELEEFRAKNQRLQKLWVGRLLLYSSVLYLLTSLVVYFLYFPEEWLQRVAMALPFFVYPVLVWAIRKLLIFLFSKRTERNNDKLEDSKAAKKKILEEVMETETYKNAKLILERFDPEAKKKAELESTPVRPHITPRPGQEIRQRGVPMRPTLMGTPVSMVMTPPPGARPPMGPGGTPVAPGGPPEKCTPSTSIHQVSVLRTPCSPIPGVGMHPPGPPLARPILPKDRGTLDRVLEFLVGDGPQNRYALICQQCFSHNGMALKEEFEYVAFRCAYCYFMNPARKTRPHAPRLPEYSYERKLRGEVRSPGHVQPTETETQDSAPPSGDEKEVEEDEGHKNVVETESQSEGQEEQQQEEEEVEKQEDDCLVQEEEEGRCEAPETESGEL